MLPAVCLSLLVTVRTGLKWSVTFCAMLPKGDEPVAQLVLIVRNMQQRKIVL